MANVMIFSENTNLAAELLTAANLIGDVKAVSINNEKQAVALASTGAQVHAVNQDSLVMADAGAVASILQQAAEELECTVVLLSSDRRGKLIAGSLAQKMKAGCLTGVIDLKMDGDKIVCQRNTLGGTVISDQTFVSPTQVIAVAPKSFASAEKADGGSIQELVTTGASTGLVFVSSQTKAGDSVDISAADILLVIGMGVENQAMIATVNDITDQLGGAVACTKPVATDRKWFDEDRIVGISGKTCKPSLAILLGISGQVQFYAGIRDSKTIASINNDENALIASMSDYILCADAEAAIQQLKSTL
ncbi:MAG TPA: electron transfer flavoprotein subunit alpha/FixB family protein, partial [Syntrophomonas sp.]|nr:electron transfer flavoprotein subunit alpha/FixB family protein [Syntrophomonas sp.]